MSHHIYHTRGLILGSIPLGESNRFYKIFTEELGLVWASAQAVRMEKSKLRYALQNFSWITLDLVKGREVWRITSAGEAIAHPILRKEIERFKIFARICALVSRMVHGERQEKEIFEDLLNFANFLEQNTAQSIPSSVEILASARVLAHLGYLDDTLNDQFGRMRGWSTDILEEFEKEREVVAVKIDEALTASHL